MQSAEQGESERERQLDAIIAEYYRLSDAGGVADQSEFIRRNPDFALELAEFFSDARLLNPNDHFDPTENLQGPTISLGTSRPSKRAAGSVARYFGEYELLEELGAGGMGVVYKARQKKLKRIVALKMIRAGELANSSDLQRFEAEAKSAAKLTHPGIVSVHEVGTHNGQHFYTMDFVEGGNLSQLHRDEPVPAKHAAYLVRQLAESMQYAHQKGIVHRDLKPANILLTAQGEPRVTDFGLAKRIHDDDESQSPTMTETGQILGTAGYMSPEQASGKSRLVGPPSDVYSLGAVLYALLTSRAPFVGETPSHTIMQVLQNEPISPRKLNPSVPRDLVTICLKCLEKEPHKRYATAQFLADDLMRFQEGKPVKARHVSSVERSWRWCRRNSILTALVAMAFLVFLGIPIVILSQVRSAVNGVQDARGLAVADQISHLHNYPSIAVTPILNHQFENESDSHRKRNLAFALADYGELDAGYLVSQIDAIADTDAYNYIAALQTNPATAFTALKAEALKCTEKPLWRRKAKLAIAALGLGKAELARDVCAFEKRPDPEQRTLFVDEFPRWDLDLKIVLAAVRDSDSPALRSGVCLSVGQFPVETISDIDKESWKSLASQWYMEHADTSTHSAAGWFLRHWKLPLPEIPNPEQISRQRDWFVNSVGSTMLRVRPEPSATAVVIADPLEKYRYQVLALINITAAELDKPQIRMQSAIAYFQIGNLDHALEDLTFLMEHDPGEAMSTVLQYRTLTLARMGRAGDARQSLATYLEQEVPASYKTFMEIVVAAWLGDTADAWQQLVKATGDSSVDPMVMYNFACAAAISAQATSLKEAGQSQQFANWAIELLEEYASRGYKNGKLVREDPDFAILHGDLRFTSILELMEEHRQIHNEIWVGDREVTRGQFEQFMNDAQCAATEKPAEWKSINTWNSPTSEHPALVNWYDAILYCNWLSLREGFLPCYERTGTKESSIRSINGPEYDAWRQVPGATGYRMLDEAEWEYVCRAGTTTNYSSGDDESLLVSYCQMYPSKATALCGEKFPNAWGLHDVHGNVMEWCWDYYEYGYKTVGWERVLRGGYYSVVASNCQSARRHADDPASNSHYGFRLALSSQSGQLADIPRTQALPHSKIMRPKHVELLNARPLIVPGPGLTSVQHSLDSPFVLLGGHDHLARLVSLSTSQEIRALHGHLHTIWSVALSPDGSTAVTGSEDKTLRYWDIASGKELDRFTAEGIFSCVRYSADGSQVFATNWDGKVRLWRHSNGKLGNPLEFSFAAATLDLALLPEKKAFIVGNNRGQILLCDADTGIIQRAFEGHSGWVHSVALVNAGKQILSAGHDSTLRLWNIESGKAESVYVGHSGIVNEVRVLPDGKRFVSCGEDRKVRLWDVISRRLLAAGVGSSELRGLSIAPDGKSCLTAGLDGSLWQWELPASTEPSSDSADAATPQLMTSSALQEHFDEKNQLSLRATDVFIENNPGASEAYYGIDWGPADGSEYIVRWGMLDNELKDREADAVRQGYKRKQVRKITANNKNIYIGLWTKRKTSPTVRIESESL